MSLYRNWASLTSIDLPWKRFVKESCGAPQAPFESFRSELNFTGEEAKTAYEEIISKESAVEPGKIINYNKKVVKPTIKSNQQSNSNIKVTANSILKAVEQQDVQFLKKHLNTENVNISDDFGWTPLMCAAYCGHLEIIKLLLKLGANRKAREKSGLTAAQLALKKNYLNIVALLRKKNYQEENWSVPMKVMTDLESCMAKHELGEEGIIDKMDEFYCTVCKATFKESSIKQHESSTLHIFNTKPKLPGAVYGISKLNKGYQMLLDSGWDEDSGLGPSGEGAKYPVKTVLKKDRKGIGLMDQQKKMLEFLECIEAKAGEILTDRQEVIALDRRRNENRVGLRAVQKDKNEKTWMAVGSLLIKFPKKTAEDLLTRDLKECDIGINKIRSDLKIKVNELRDLEHNPPVPGLMLQPLNRGEMDAFNQIVGKGL
ncbi:G patch domain and ankyrin repeat-containing protein 1 homolog [Cephus cinctus]|uniref:G patch domain and ankyrin repeat-containing protein 1 homolog n=1 Tax=Cephus cinctus TaxID=211228 RepID=A0AAJ7C9A3_CEPCN|nr:G patch domain and ankyrin repeat-containing protein 1 homolog [Cephus cinctus]